MTDSESERRLQATEKPVHLLSDQGLEGGRGPQMAAITLTATWRVGAAADCDALAGGLPAVDAVGGAELRGPRMTRRRRQGTGRRLS